MSKKEKSKTESGDRGGPFGVGSTVEEVKNTNIFEFLQDTSAFKDLTGDLDEKQLEEVLKESKRQSEEYQKVFEFFKQTLSTKEGQDMFRKMASKKMGGK